MYSEKPINEYRINLFYHGKKLDHDLLLKVVNDINHSSDKEKTNFVDIFSYLGIESVYNDYKELIYLGLDLNIQNELGFTILHYAYILKDSEFIEYLLKNGANPDTKVFKGPHSGKKPIDFF